MYSSSYEAKTKQYSSLNKVSKRIAGRVFWDIW